jgi:hypothetical protein
VKLLRDYNILVGHFPCGAGEGAKEGGDRNGNMRLGKKSGWNVNY